MTNEKSEFQEVVADQARQSADVHLAQSGAEGSAVESAPTVESAPSLTKIDPMIGKTIANKFLIESVIGSGGMSTVYKAKHLLLNSTVAVKVMLPDRSVDDTAIRRFQQEAKASTALNHSNIVRIFDFGVDEESRPYMVMELVEGESLAHVIKEQGAISANRAIDIISQACEALEHAHDKGIIHRDIKPGNIILCHGAADQEQIKIVDFGIAKILSTDTQDLTQTGEIFGSPLYMSPEQCRGKQLDVRSDVYSLACTMYEMLSGNPPFCAANAIETIFQHLNKKPAGLKRTNSGNKIDERLEKVVMRGLEKNPAARFQSMRALRVDLARVKAGLNPSLYLSTRKAISLMGIASSLCLMLVVTYFLTSFMFMPEWRKLDVQAMRSESKGDYNGACELLDQAVEKALKAHASDSDMLDLLGNEGKMAAVAANQSQKAAGCYRKAAGYAEAIGNLPQAIALLELASDEYHCTHVVMPAVESLQQALPMQSKLTGNDSEEMAALFKRVAIAYEYGDSRENKRDAETYFQKAISIFEKKPPVAELQECYHQSGVVQHDLSKHALAAESYKKAADIHLTLTGNKDELWHDLMNRSDNERRWAKSIEK